MPGNDSRSDPSRRSNGRFPPAERDAGGRFDPDPALGSSMFATCLKRSEIGESRILSSGLTYDAKCLVVNSSPRGEKSTKTAVKGGSVLLPLGSPLPDDAVAAKRGESGMLGGLSVPLKWGVAVPPDDYDHWAPEPEDGTDANDKAADGLNPEVATEGTGEWNEWDEWSAWEAEAEPRFDMPRTTSVIPTSPAAG